VTTHALVVRAAAGQLPPWAEATPERREHMARVAALLAGSLLHGPAAAEKLRIDGVRDAGLLHAVAYHTLGHADLGPEGRALYAADFLEPGRLGLRDDWRTALRARMPGEVHDVVREILSARVVHLVETGRPVRPETMGFWNSMAREG
jgi:HD superfamily phosphohydrolase YqeK